MDKETFRIKLENDQLKRQLQKEKADRLRLEQEYRELAEFAQRRGGGWELMSESGG